MGSKRGNVEIFILSITILLMLVILTSVFLLHIQINTCIYNIKSDLFYISQNAYLAADHEELAYSNYEVNDELLSEKIEYLIKLNHSNYDFYINEIKYDYINKNVLININLLINPIVLKDMIGIISLNIKETVKLRLMEVK